MTKSCFLVIFKSSKEDNFLIFEDATNSIFFTFFPTPIEVNILIRELFYPNSMFFTILEVTLVCLTSYKIINFSIFVESETRPFPISSCDCLVLAVPHDPVTVYESFFELTKVGDVLETVDYLANSLF